MNVIVRPPVVTFEDFCEHIQDWQKADLIDGVVYMASPENWQANTLFVWLLSLLDAFNESRELGQIVATRVAFRLDITNAPEPDIAFVTKKRWPPNKPGYFDGPPDLAIEIVCPESVHRDYQQKRRQYQKFGVREYWIVDDIDQRLTCFCLGKDGKFREVRPRQGKLHSRVLKGFWLKPEWLWQRPFPKKAKILKEILAKDK